MPKGDSLKQVNTNCPIMPLKNYVVIERIEPTGKKGVIIVPDSAKQLPTFGVVLAVGIGVTEVKPRHCVLFGKYNGVDVPIKDKQYLLLREEDILAILADGDLAESFFQEGA